MFDPKTNKFPYPEDTGTHYLGVKKDNGNVYDDKYPYIDKSFGFRFKRFWFYIFALLIAFPIQSIRMGFRVKGRKNLRDHKDEIKKGVISVANHVHMWDYMSIMNALFPRKTNILAWDKNISGENGKMIRMSGGIPVPNNSKGFYKMSKATIEHIKNGGWLHVASEASMWEYYAPIRPFKEGAAFFAYNTKRPIIPMAFTYRPVGWFRKKIFHQIAKLTLNIGEPLYIDETLPQTEAIKKLTIESHKAVCALAGFKEGENIYPPLYNQDTNKRIDYYTTEYGVGYKGSW